MVQSFRAIIYYTPLARGGSTSCQVGVDHLGKERSSRSSPISKTPPPIAHHINMSECSHSPSSNPIAFRSIPAVLPASIQCQTQQHRSANQLPHTELVNHAWHIRKTNRVLYHGQSANVGMNLVLMCTNTRCTHSRYNAESTRDRPCLC